MINREILYLEKFQTGVKVREKEHDGVLNQSSNHHHYMRRRVLVFWFDL